MITNRSDFHRDRPSDLAAAAWLLDEGQFDPADEGQRALALWAARMAERLPDLTAVSARSA